MEGDRYFYGTYLEQREHRKTVIREVYQNSSDALKSAAQDGVDYIIQTKWLTPEFEGRGCSLAYETDSVAVWQIDR